LSEFYLVGSEASSVNTRFVLVAVGIAALGGVLFGFDLVVVAGAVLFIQEQLKLAAGLEEVVVSAALAGATIGAALAGSMADRLGRRHVLFATAAVFAVGAGATALAPSAGWLIGGRAVVGLAIGSVSVAAPLYISEIAPSETRGRMVAVYILGAGVGSLLAFSIDYLFSARQAWRWMFASGIVPALLLAIGMLTLPETPRWLVRHGRIEEGRRVLERFRGSPGVEDELAGINARATASGTWRDLLDAALGPVLFAGIGLAILQRVTGMVIPAMYGPDILKQAGMGSDSVDILASIGMGVAMIASALVGIQLIDRAGRRRLLVAGFSGMLLGIVLLSLAFIDLHAPPARWLALAGILVLLAAWTAGPGMVVFTLLSEIYPLTVRGQAMSASTVAMWVAYTLVTMTFLTLIDGLGPVLTFALFGVLCVAAVLFTLRFAPETKGRSLEQIEAAWTDERRGRP
jgi:sugar porter (SP) family MFS transporter